MLVRSFVHTTFLPEMSRGRLPVSREEEQRNRSELDRHRECDDSRDRNAIEQSRRDAPDEPTATVAGVENPERKVPATFRQSVRDERLEQGVLNRIADAPEQH